MKKWGEAGPAVPVRLLRDLMGKMLEAPRLSDGEYDARVLVETWNDLRALCDAAEGKPR